MPSPPFGDLLAHPAVAALARLAAGNPCHLVGGVLRDRVLGRPTHDLDAVVAGRGREIALALADACGGRFVALGGKEFAAYRIVATRWELDLWDREEMSLAEDLARRDLTINAIAVDLETGGTIDPFDGLGDLDRRRLRATTPASFTDDPLRVLRLARFAADLPGFVAEAETVALAHGSARDLSTVAVERIRDELERILGSDRALDGVRMLAATGAYPGLYTDRLGEVAPAEEVAETLAALSTYERALALLSPARTAPAAPTGRAALLIARAAGDDAAATVERCRVRGLASKPEAQAIGRLVTLTPLPASERERRLVLHGLGPALWPAAAAFLAALDGLDETALGALSALARDHGEEIFDPPRLLGSDEIRDLLALPPGPALGRAIAALRAAQVQGDVRSADEARSFLAALPPPDRT